MNHAMRIATAILPGILLVLTGSGCSQGETMPGLTSFGSPGYGEAGGSPGTDGSDDDTGGDSEDSEDDASDGNAGDDPADDPNAEGDTGAPPPDGMTDDGMPPPDGMTDDGAPPPGGGTQPVSGLWASCTQADQAACGATTDGCMTVSLPTGEDGFCTMIGCSNPAADCGPAPAGSSVTPICMPVAAESVCALECSVAACPTGMQCVAVAIDEAGTMTENICV